jgi:hypothetical protein
MCGLDEARAVFSARTAFFGAASNGFAGVQQKKLVDRFADYLDVVSAHIMQAEVVTIRTCRVSV